MRSRAAAARRPALVRSALHFLNAAALDETVRDYVEKFVHVRILASTLVRTWSRLCGAVWQTTAGAELLRSIRVT